MVKIQRTFYPGDQWLYFRIYTGIKTADSILINLESVLSQLKKKNIISEWFFIRYHDPDFHIRLRILLTDINHIGHAIIQCNKRLKKACNDSLINRIEIGTYQRELERYRKKDIDLSEKLFSIDSECIVSILSYLQKKDENLRWQTALVLADRFFDDLKYDLEKKHSCINQLSDAYKREFGYNMYNSKQLNQIYRDRKTQIESAIKKGESQKNPDFIMINKILARKSQQLKRLIKDVKDTSTANIPSHIHMSMNRIFRSQARTHELLIYDFLSRFYKSEIAKQKYN